MIKTQNRDGLPASITEEQRFFELRSLDKTATPAGWNNPANWKTLDEIPEGRPFGYAVGNNSTKLLVDYDHVFKDGKVVPWVKDAIKRLRKVCVTYSEPSISGTGYHQIVDLGDFAESFASESNGYDSIIVDMPIDEYRALPKEERDKVPKIEFWFKTEGRYVLLTGANKVANEVAKDDVAAAFFHELLKIRQEMREKHNSLDCQNSNSGNSGLQGVQFEIDDLTRQRVLEALPYISADCSREEWVHIGIALHHCGFDFDVWDTWSQYKDQRTGEASDKYVDGDTEKIWKSFANNKSHWNAGTIISMAKKNGYAVSKTNAPAVIEYSDTSELSEAQALELSKNETLDLVTSKKGSVLSIPENYYTILCDDAYLHGKLRYNQLDGRVYAHGFYWAVDDHPVRDVDLFNIRRFISAVYRIRGKDDILDNIYAVADFNAYHPVREMLNSLKWDGVERISELLPRYLGADRSSYTTAVTKLLLYAVIQRVFHPGIKFDTAIILADTKQGTGKSTLCRLLALQDDWYTDSLDDLNDNKRAFEALRGHIIVELGEMIATRRARDIETIKGYLSRTADDYRTPHAKFTERYPRQAVFIGTTNKSQFLPDDRTGNRRFIPVLCDGNQQKIHPMANMEEAREYVRQCYAEAMVKGKQEGFPLVLSKEHEDRLRRLQEVSAPEDEKVGIIQEWLDTQKPSFVCTRMIYDYALPNVVNCNRARGNTPEKWQLAEIAEILNTSIEGYTKYMGNDGSNAGAKKYFGTGSMGDNYGYQRAWMRVEHIPSDIPRDIPTDQNHIPSDGDLDGFKAVQDDEYIPL